ncbi:MAG: hypothetical protein IT486_01080 [Gammaproteobacteria bacterium]|nr:hypothetical protein [Gammaproteobacteria bacterium]
MRKTLSIIATLALLAVAQTANAVRLELVAHNQRSASSLSTLKWKECAPTATTNPCLSTTNAWTLANALPSTAVWTWNPGTGVLSMTGLFQTTSHIGSDSDGPSVISDKVTDLVIDTTNDTTTAASYVCVEGTFLAAVGAHGCANLNIGFGPGAYQSSIAYNVGGDANCVQRTIGGNDVSTGPPRTLATTAGGGGCDPGAGAFDLWTIVQDGTATRGQLIISNGIDIALANTNYLTFQVLPDAVDDGPVNALQGVPVNVDVMANDELFVDNVTVTVTTAPTKGTAVVNGSPGPQAGISITYTGGAGQTGADSFVYTVLDNDGTTSDTATVTLNVLAGGANADTATTTRNAASFAINVGANDVGFTDPVTITVETGPDQGGTATPPGAGAAATREFTYAPGTKPAGTPTYTETFTYRITDATSLTATATVTVTVNNAVPVAGDAPMAISTAGLAPGAATTGSLNAATFPGNSLGNAPNTVTATDGANGTTSVSGTVVTYTPAGTFFAGSDTFTYTITDSDPGTAETDTGTVTVTIADVAPALANGAITTAQDTAAAPFALGITLGNGSQAQHGVAVTTDAANGACALAGTSVTYTPDAGYSGADRCVVTITDGDGDTDTGTLTITVTPAPGGGGVGGGGLLPGGGGSLDGLTLALLAGAAAWMARRRRVAGR